MDVDMDSSGQSNPVVMSSTTGKDSEEDLLDSSGDKQEKGAKKTLD